MSEPGRTPPLDDALALFLCGDVMLGRGVDQILPHAGNPRLYERMVHDARSYVDLALRANGPIPQPVDWSWPWGDAIDVIKNAGCDARIINLETSITTSDDYAQGKAVHYRMNPANIKALAAIQPDACVLANNHVLDFGRSGLLETLDVLFGSGHRYVGAGRSLREALAPAVIPIPKTGGRVLAVYQEPMGKHWQLFCILPLDKVEATPYQRDLSPTHAKRLQEVVKKIDRFVDNYVAVASRRFPNAILRFRQVFARVRGALHLDQANPKLRIIHDDSIVGRIVASRATKLEHKRRI
jgi:poly-gamma-glutamate capsule biosynthesis protein CapA/YwtB (metallophosphatase superfamily)